MIRLVLLVYIKTSFLLLGWLPALTPNFCILELTIDMFSNCYNNKNNNNDNDLISSISTRWLFNY